MVNYSLDGSVSPGNPFGSCFPDFELEGCWSRKRNQNSQNDTMGIPKRNDEYILGWPTSTKARNSLKAKKPAAKELRHAGIVKMLTLAHEEWNRSKWNVICVSGWPGGAMDIVPFKAWSIPLQVSSTMMRCVTPCTTPINTNKLCPPIHNILSYMLILYLYTHTVIYI